MKGVILCGGYGERLKPITNYINKHLLLIYNKPMFYYPLSILLLIGCKEIYIVGNQKDFKNFKKSLPKKILKKIKFYFIAQKKPNGIAFAVGLLSKYFKKKEKGIFILGDNFFYGNNLINIILSSFKKKNSAIFLTHANDPWNYGTIKDNNKKIIFSEKKKNSDANSVITGLYIFDKESLELSNKILKSKRGEYEITDMISLIYQKKKLSIFRLGRGIVWYDMGTFKNINKASNFVELLETRQGLEIGNIS